MMMMGLWMIIPLLLVGGATLLLVGVAAYALGWRPKSSQTRLAQTSQTPLEILDARYAHGEITREEYEQVRLDLAD